MASIEDIRFLGRIVLVRLRNSCMVKKVNESLVRNTFRCKDIVSPFTRPLFGHGFRIIRTDPITSGMTSVDTPTRKLCTI